MRQRRRCALGRRRRAPVPGPVLDATRASNVRPRERPAAMHGRAAHAGHEWQALCRRHYVEQLIRQAWLRIRGAGWCAYH